MSSNGSRPVETIALASLDWWPEWEVVVLSRNEMDRLVNRTKWRRLVNMSDLPIRAKYLANVAETYVLDGEASDYSMTAGVRDLARRGGMAVRTCRRAYDDLVAAGWLVPEHEGNGHARRTWLSVPTERPAWANRVTSDPNRVTSGR
jgi:hypothetical protein